MENSHDLHLRLEELKANPCSCRARTVIDKNGGQIIKLCGVIPCCMIKCDISSRLVALILTILPLSNVWKVDIVVWASGKLLHFRESSDSDVVQNFIFEMDTKKLILECQPNMSPFHEISHFEFIFNTI